MTPEQIREREEILDLVNGTRTIDLANKILLRMISSVMTVNGIVNHGKPLEEQAYDLAVKMNDERIKRGL